MIDTIKRKVIEVAEAICSTCQYAIPTRLVQVRSWQKLRQQCNGGYKG